MEPFQLFFEKYQAPVEVLEKYKDDPDVTIRFATPFEPFGARPSYNYDSRKYAKRETIRFGVNPRTTFNTPVGICGYPLQCYWNTIKSLERIPYVSDAPFVWIYKPRNPEKCPRNSTYTEENYQNDFETLQEIFTNYDMKQLFDEASDYYKGTPLRNFWTLTRELAERIETKYESTPKRIIWTQIMRRFYDGIIDDIGEKMIHGNEPFQTIFWTSAQVDLLDYIDRTHGGRFTRTQYHSPTFWQQGPKTEVLRKPNVVNLLRKNIENGTPEKIPPTLMDALDDNMKRAIELAGVGDEMFAEELWAGNSQNVTSFFDSMFRLWVKRGSPSTRFLTSDMMYNIKPKTFEEYPEVILRSMVEAEASPYCHRLIMAILNRQPPTEENTGVYTQLVRISDVDGLWLLLKNDDLKNLVLSGKIPLKMFCDVWNKENSLVKYCDNSIWLETGTIILDLLKKLDPHCESVSLWESFFHSFVNMNNDTYYRASLLDRFLFDCVNTDIIEGLRDFIRRDMDISVLGEEMNDVFQKHYGVRPFEITPDIEEQTRKPRRIKRGDFVHPKGRRNDVYIVFGNVDRNGEELENGTISVLTQNGMFDYYHFSTLVKVKNFDKKKLFQSNDRVSALMALDIATIPQHEVMTVMKNLEKSFQAKIKRFERNQLVRMNTDFEQDGTQFFDYYEDSPRYGFVRYNTNSKDDSYVTVIGPYGKYFYMNFSDVELVNTVDYRFKDEVQDEDGNIGTVVGVAKTGKIIVEVKDGGGHMREMKPEDLMKYSIFDNLKIVDEIPVTYENTKNGDFVRCVDTGGNNSLVFGKIYNVKGNYPDMTTIEDEDGDINSYYHRRFVRLVLQGEEIKTPQDDIDPPTSKIEKEIPATQENLSVGDYVRCIDPGDMSHITKDKIYRVLSFPNYYTSPTIEITNDDGVNKNYFIHRFNKIVFETDAEDSTTDKNPPPKYKTGDKVKLKKYSDEGYWKGTVTSTEQQSDGTYKIAVKWTDNSNSHEDESDPSLSLDTDPPPKSKYNEGDHVKLVNSTEGDFHYGQVSSVNYNDAEEYYELSIDWNDGDHTVEREDNPNLYPDIKI